MTCTITDTVYLCYGCDAERDTRWAYCDCCEEISDGYPLEPEAAWERDLAPLSVVAEFLRRSRESHIRTLEALYEAACDRVDRAPFPSAEWHDASRVASNVLLDLTEAQLALEARI